MGSFFVILTDRDVFFFPESVIMQKRKKKQFGSVDVFPYHSVKIKSCNTVVSF